MELLDLLASPQVKRPKSLESRDCAHPNCLDVYIYSLCGVKFISRKKLKRRERERERWRERKKMIKTGIIPLPGLAAIFMILA